jgi:LysR family transcriptional regulator, low CO2-responsive transcriptional regulator
MMNLYQLELFAAVVANGNVTRTAEALYISQPALSSRIRALEESLGEQLFEQVGRRIYLTDAGQELYKHAGPILQQVAEAKRAVAEVRSMERGSLRIVATTTVGTYVLPRILGTFHRAHPGVALELDVTNELRAVEAVRRHGTDLAVLGPIDTATDMVIEDFMRNELFIAAAPDHPLAYRGAIQFAELAGYPVLLREEGSGTRAVLARIYAERDLKPIVAMELRHSAAIKQGIMAGLGVGLLSEHETVVERANGSLVALQIEGLSIRHDWHIIHRRERRLPRAAVAFKNMLLGYAAEHALDRADTATPIELGA